MSGSYFVYLIEHLFLLHALFLGCKNSLTAGSSVALPAFHLCSTLNRAILAGVTRLLLSLLKKISDLPA